MPQALEPPFDRGAGIGARLPERNVRSVGKRQTLIQGGFTSKNAPPATMLTIGNKQARALLFRGAALAPASVAWRRPLIALLLCAATARGGLRDDFETPEPAWRDAGGDARYRITQRLRIAQDARSGQGCEFWEVESEGDGSTIYLSYDVGHVPVIDESAASLWMRCDRAGVQLLARVVFPRTLDPQSNQPVSALVYGTSYDAPGQWRKLSLANVARQVEQQARILRVQLRAPVDTRQAFLDRLLLNAYVGEGRHRLWIDELEVTGVVYPGGQQIARPGGGAPSAGSQAPGQLPAPVLGGVVATPISRGASDAEGSAASNSAVELKGQTLSVAGKAFFPRVIDYQGEPLEFLKRLGFNAVHLTTPPAPEMLAEARRLGLWLICPPPEPPGLETPYNALTAATDFGPDFQAVLAWDMGSDLTSADLEQLKRRAEYVRRRDMPRPRPLVCEAAADLRSLSRQVDIVAARRMTLGTSFELSDYGAWVRERSRLMRPGTPTWGVVQTQPVRELARQAQLLSVSSPPRAPQIEAEQIRLMVFESLAAGVRGLRFESQSPLNLADDASRTRAAALQLINLELQVIDLWAASGTFVSRVPGSEADVSAALLQIDRGHLLLPMWTGTHAQYVPGQSAGSGLAFVVPGVPDSVDAYELSPGGMRPLVRQRVTGGVRVTLDEFSLTSLVVLTQDPQVVGLVASRLREVSPVAVQLQRELTAAKLRTAEQVQAELSIVAPPVRQAGGWLAAANRSLTAADVRIAQGNVRDGYLETRRALRPLALLERAQWQNAVQAGESSTLTPFTSSFASLPEHWRMLERLRTIAAWENLLPAGEFESLDRLIEAGWRHFQHSQEGVRAEADLSQSTRSASTGETSGPATRPTQFCLRLSAHPADEAASQSLLDTAPAWITSPPVRVSAGQVLRFTGWINVPATISGSRDGAIVFDSIAGEPVALRFTKTEGWQRFTYYRMAPLDGEVTLTIALTGFGQVLVDDVTIDAAR